MSIDIDLDALSLKQMRELQTRLERAISTYEERARREALAAIKATAKDYGFSLDDLTGGKAKGGASVAPKYINPDDPTMTWSGRGRKPHWVVEQLDAGKQMEDLLI